MRPLGFPIAAVLRHRLVQTGLGLAVGGALLWFAFARIDTGDLLRRLAQVQIAWLLLALACYWVALAIRSWRWRIILSPVSRLTFFQVYHGLVVGYAANNVLPARLGELVRADYLGRRNGISRLSVVGTIVVERLFDVVVFIGFIVAGIAGLHGRPNSKIPEILHAVELVALACVLLGLVLFGLLRFRHKKLPASLSFLENPIRSLTAGLHLISGLQEVVMLIAATAVVWTADSTSTWLLCRAMDVNPSFMDLLLIMGMSCGAALIPAAPANAGALQAALQLAFILLGFGEAAGNQLGFELALLVQGCFVGTCTVAGALLYFVSSVGQTTRRASSRSS
ncbi:MAG TPA: lysylphosphatidylglycerol synthase transmembrane domain-containing protein [Candidatus Udaeobacter sp.]|nr:lysylphosphatidylglycerol synthase transmembrane domain-containing protein [Candidatus Udaeobacter sp.]